MNTTAFRKACSLLLFCCSLSSSFAQYDFKWQTNGTVNTSVISNNTLYLGGNFNYVGPYTGCFTGIDLFSAWDKAWPVVNSDVYAIAQDGAGGFYIGGNFTEVGGVPMNHLAHIRSDKTVDLAWRPNASGLVYSITVDGGSIYIGGSFSTVNNTTRNNVAALDYSGNLTFWNPNINGLVRALRVVNGVIYAGGDFTTAGGIARKFFAAIDITGSITGLDLGIVSSAANGTGSVNTLEASSDTLYIGGTYWNTIGGQSRNSLASLKTSTGNITSWNPAPSGTFTQVSAIALQGANAYIGGNFSKLGGLSRKNIACINTSTGSATTWNPSANGTVLSLYAVGSMIYAGGQFTGIGLQTRNKLAAIDINGTLASWDPNAGNGWDVFAVTGNGTEIMTGGDFTSINGQTRSNVASIDLTNNVITCWDPSTDANVNALAVTSSKVYLGGDFSLVNGTLVKRIAAVDKTNGTFAGFAVNVDNSVRAIAVSPGEDTVYIGGDFLNAGNIAHPYIAALNVQNNSVFNSWNAAANGIVRTLAYAGGALYAGGDFTNMNATVRNHLAAIDRSGTLTNWDPNANNTVRTIIPYNGLWFIGGDFTSVNGGIIRNRIAAINVSGTATVWDPNASGIVRSIAIWQNIAYVVGDFNFIGGQTRFSHMAAIDITTNTNNVLAWNPILSSGVYINSISVSYEKIFIGGSFFMLKSARSFYLSYIPGLGSPLPVHLIQFNAAKQSGNVLVQWKVTDTDAETIFEVQRKAGNAIFYSIYHTTSVTAVSEQQLSMLDKGLDNGTYYYRLKIIEPRGKITYSEIRTVIVDDPHIRIVPTMLSRGSNIMAQMPGDNYQMIIYNSSGQKMMSQSLNQGMNNIATTTLSKGIYILKIQKNNEVKQTGRIVVL